MEQGSPTPTGRTQFGPRSTEHNPGCESAVETTSVIPWARMQHLKLLAFFTIVSTVLATALIFALPNRSWLASEDNVVENLSVVFYGLAFFVAIFRWIRSRQQNHPAGWLPGVAALGLLGALEELSYGQRIFDYGVPLIAGVELDALHDFTNIAYEMLKNGYATNAALVATVSAGCVSLFGYCAIRFGSRTISIVKGSQSLLILSFLAFLIVAAVVIDLEIIEFGPVRVYEEIFEMNAAFAALLLSLVVNKSMYEK